MSSWPFDQRGGLTDAELHSDDPVVCAYQMMRLEILLASLTGKPEQSSMVLHRLEIACYGANKPVAAADAHSRALAEIDRCGYAAVEAWERQPRLIRRLAAPLRESFEARHTDRLYRAGMKAIDKALTELQTRSPWKDAL